MVEPKWFERGVREVIQIWINNPTLNKDAGRYNLLSVWDNTLKAPERRGGGGTSSLDLQSGVVVSQRSQHPLIRSGGLSDESTQLLRES